LFLFLFPAPAIEDVCVPNDDDDVAAFAECTSILARAQTLPVNELIVQSHKLFRLVHCSVNERPQPSVPELVVSDSPFYTAPAVGALRHNLEIPSTMEILKCTHFNAALLERGMPVLVLMHKAGIILTELLYLC
jgi:hypothetical protein